MHQRWGIYFECFELTAEHWQELELPLNASSWSEEDLKDPEKLYEMTVLLNAQREIADKIKDVQWETKWRQEKVSSDFYVGYEGNFNVWKIFDMLTTLCFLETKFET